MRLDKLPQSDRIEDRRGAPGGGFRGARTGGIGIGTVIVLGLVGWALGIDPSILIQGRPAVERRWVTTTVDADRTWYAVRCHGPVRLRRFSAARRPNGPKFLLNPQKSISRQPW